MHFFTSSICDLLHNTGCIDNMTDYTQLPTAPPPQNSQHGELLRLCAYLQWLLPINIHTDKSPAYFASPESMPQSCGSTNPGYQEGVQQPPYNTAYPPSSYQPPAPVYNTSNTTGTVLQMPVVQTQPNLPIYRPKPSSYIWLSVITMICCCCVLGLVALINGLEV